MEKMACSRVLTDGQGESSTEAIRWPEASLQMRHNPLHNMEGGNQVSASKSFTFLNGVDEEYGDVLYSKDIHHNVGVAERELETRADADIFKLEMTDLTGPMKRRRYQLENPSSVAHEAIRGPRTAVGVSERGGCFGVCGCEMP